MAELFSSGSIAALVLAFMVAELVLLALHRRVTGSHYALTDIALSLLAGAGLVLALGAALSGARWQVIAAFLVLAMVGHCADVYRRFLRG